MKSAIFHWFEKFSGQVKSLRKTNFDDDVSDEDFEMESYVLRIML